jgi:WD40 repeat protein
MAVETLELEPYVGPRPFGRTADDRARFFGRDRETEEIVSLVVSHSVVLVYAQSGAGKSSLFDAQVAQQLETKGFQVFPLARVRAAIPDDVDRDTIQNLYVFAALLSIEPQEGERTQGGASLAAMSLHEYLKERAPDPPAPRCIVCDQFEEIFTDEAVFALRPASWQKEQETFFRQVAEAVAEDPLLRVVFVIRKEHLAELDRFADFLPEGLRTRFHLEPLGRKAALSAITLPLRNTRRAFDEGVPEDVVAKLLTMRVDTGGGIKEVEGRFVEPLHLQLVCESLWRDLAPDETLITEEHVRKLGDVDHVLGDLYDDAVRKASASAHMPEKRLRRQIERQFITPAQTRGLVFVGDTAGGTGFRHAVDELERQHLVRAEWHSGADWYELTHDRLIEPILASNARFRASAAKKRNRVIAAGLAIAAVAGGTAAGAVLAANSDEPAQEQLFQLVQIARLRAGGETAPAVRAAFSPDGSLVVTPSEDGTARVWDWDKGEVVTTLRAGSAPLSDAAFSPDGLKVVTAAGDGATRIWDWSTRRIVAVLRHRAQVATAVFDPDGSRVLTASADGVARVWNWDAGEVVAELHKGNAPLYGAAFSPDGRLVVTAGVDGTARVWDWDDQRMLADLRGGKRPAPVLDAEFSPDGERVVTAGSDRLARVWEWDARKTEALLRHPAQVASAVFFAPVGRYLVTASADGTARVWDWPARKVAAELHPAAQPQPDPLTDAALSPVGALVVTTGVDGVVRIYGPQSVSG